MHVTEGMGPEDVGGLYAIFERRRLLMASPDEVLKLRCGVIDLC